MGCHVLLLGCLAAAFLGRVRGVVFVVLFADIALLGTRKLLCLSTSLSRSVALPVLIVCGVCVDVLVLTIISLLLLEAGAGLKLRGLELGRQSLHFLDRFRE
jgi:hypothetical protein